MRHLLRHKYRDRFRCFFSAEIRLLLLDWRTRNAENTHPRLREQRQGGCLLNSIGLFPCQVIGSTAFGFIIAMVTVIVETMDPQVGQRYLVKTFA